MVLLAYTQGISRVRFANTSNARADSHTPGVRVCNPQPHSLYRISCAHLESKYSARQARRTHARASEHTGTFISTANAGCVYIHIYYEGNKIACVQTECEHAGLRETTPEGMRVMVGLVSVLNQLGAVALVCVPCVCVFATGRHSVAWPSVISVRPWAPHTNPPTHWTKPAAAAKRQRDCRGKSGLQGACSPLTPTAITTAAVAG